MTMKGSCTSCTHFLDVFTKYCSSCNDGHDKYESIYNNTSGEAPLDDMDITFDPVHPTHYPDSRHGDIISICMDNQVGFCEGNIMKYVYRWRKKGGYEDLLKAKEYLNRLLRFYKNKDINEEFNG